MDTNVLESPKILVLGSISQSENVTYRPYRAHGCVKLDSKQTYGIHTTDIMHPKMQLKTTRMAICIFCFVNNYITS